MKTFIHLRQSYIPYALIILFFASCSKDIQDTPTPATSSYSNTDLTDDFPPGILDSIFTKEQINAEELLEKITNAGMVIHKGKTPPEIFSFSGRDTVGLTFNVDHTCIYDDINPTNVDSVYGQYVQSLRILMSGDSTFEAHVSYSSIGDPTYPQYPSGLDHGSGSGYASGSGNNFTVFYKVNNGVFDNIPYQAIWIVSGTVSNSPDVQEINGITKCLLMLEKGADPDDKVANPGTLRIFKDSTASWNQPEVVISDFSPDSGSYSTVVTIIGSGFSAEAGENIVRFNNATANVLEATTNQLQVVVPKGAGTGPVTVQVSNKTGTGDVFKYLLVYMVTTLADTGGSIRFNNPHDVAVDSEGNVYVADTENNSILKITPQGEVSTLSGEFSSPHGVAVDSEGNVYVADTGNNSVLKITPQGEVSTLSGEFSSPHGVAVDSEGNVYVADTENNSIYKISLQGEVSTLSGEFSSPHDVAVDSEGNVYVADTGNNSVLKITLQGEVSTLSGEFSSPYGVAVDEQGNVYVADTGNHRIQMITPRGDVKTIAGTGQKGFMDGIGSSAQFNSPSGIAVDSKGVIYVADEENNSIRKMVLE